VAQVAARGGVRWARSRHLQRDPSVRRLLCCVGGTSTLNSARVTCICVSLTRDLWSLVG
jgi:hypothetical protein